MAHQLAVPSQLAAQVLAVIAQVAILAESRLAADCFRNYLSANFVIADATAVATPVSQLVAAKRLPAAKSQLVAAKLLLAASQLAAAKLQLAVTAVAIAVADHAAKNRVACSPSCSVT